MSTVTRDLLNAVPPPEVWTSDFVIRSLRRRLWKAFQEDDGETALRAYQASLEDFETWLHEEEEESWKLRDELAASTAKSGSKRIFLKRRSSKDASRLAGTRKDVRRSSTTSKTNNILDKLACKTEKDPELILACSTESAKSDDLKHLDGPILQSHINPSEPFIADDFLSPYESYSMPAQKMLPDPQKREREKELRKRRSRGPRLAAFNIFKKEEGPKGEENFEDTESDAIFREDPTMTTPLHEAARLGAGDFLRILLANGGDPNVKNGYSRTALHMCSGGITKEEKTLIAAALRKKRKNSNEGNGDEPGLQAPSIPADVLALMNSDLKKATEQKGKARKAAKKVGKLLNSAMRSSTRDLHQDEPSKQFRAPKVRPNATRLNHIAAERMDAVLAILSWVQAETGDGPSLNAVDADGRTALHYAAELGRSDVCMAILSNFGAMLTVVDEIGARTPCELAADRGHNILAAQLEARALLYIDPYGLDDELMATVLTNEMANDEGEWNPRSQLTAPFTWFSTASYSDVAEDRAKRLVDAGFRMKKAIALWDGARDMKSLMAKAAKVGLDAAMDGSDDEPDTRKNSMSAVMASAEKFGLDVALGRKPEKISSDDDSESEEKTTKKMQQKNDQGKTIEDEKAALERLRDTHIERFLSYHKWNVGDAIKQFRKKPVEALSKAGVELPEAIPAAEAKSDERMCLICYDDEVEEEDWVDMSWCGHGFCVTCLRDYLKDCAVSKSAVATITCPHHECSSGIPQSMIEKILSAQPDDLSRIINANTEKFVSAAEDYKFCTHPGCQGIVKRIPQPFLVSNGIDLNFLNYAGAVCVGIPSADAKGGCGYTLTYEGVDDPDYNNCRSERQPRRAHRFCFACGEDMHWPVSCERLEQWKQKMREQVKEVEGENEDENNVNEVAQRLWMKANTRPCPECKVPIEKNDGCNHMTCTNPNCRHEFCWICRKDWKLHGTATGGFFRCNIWQEGEAPPDADKTNDLTPRDASDSDGANEHGYGTAIYSSREQWKERQEMARFLHHYTRWEAHGDSATLERKMGDTVCERLAPVVKAAAEFDGSPNFNFGGKGLSFVHSAFMELQECRSVLKHSYAFSFFRYPAFCQVRRYGQLSSRRREKMNFESLQSELEMMTEQMSDVVARSHLRATQVQIMFLTATTAEKREEFSNLMFSIMNDEKKESKKAKHAKSGDPGESRSSRRYRNTYSMSTSLGSLARVVDDSWSSDTEQIADGDLRSTLEEFMSRAVPLDPPERNDVATRMWACQACTYMNSGGSRCAICGGSRPR